MKKLSIFLALAIIFMSFTAYASETCDNLFTRNLNAIKVLYERVEKEWPKFDFNDDTFELLKQYRNTRKEYKENCLDHYAYRDVEFVKRQDVLRLNLGFTDGGKKIKGDTAPGVPYAFFFRERHPESITGYIKPNSIEVKGNKIFIDVFKDTQEIAEQPSYCIVKRHNLEEYVIACGENIEKTFLVPVPTITRNGNTIDEEFIELPGEGKVRLRGLQHLFGFLHISHDIISWLEKEMIPRGYLKPVSAR